MKQRGVLTVADVDMIDVAVQWHRHAFTLKHLWSKFKLQRGGGTGVGVEDLREEERLSREAATAIEKRSRAVSRLKLTRRTMKTAAASAFDVEDPPAEVEGVPDESVWGDAALELSAERAEAERTVELGLVGRDLID